MTDIRRMEYGHRRERQQPQGRGTPGRRTVRQEDRTGLRRRSGGPAGRDGQGGPAGVGGPGHHGQGAAGLLEARPRRGEPHAGRLAGPGGPWLAVRQGRAGGEHAGRGRRLPRQGPGRHGGGGEHREEGAGHAGEARTTRPASARMAAERRGLHGDRPRHHPRQGGERAALLRARPDPMPHPGGVQGRGGPVKRGTVLHVQGDPHVRPSHARGPQVHGPRLRVEGRTQGLHARRQDARRAVGRGPRRLRGREEGEGQLVRQRPQLHGWQERP